MNSGFDMYQNSGYVNTRNRKKTLILDIDDSATGDTHLGAGGEFNIQLIIKDNANDADTIQSKIFIENISPIINVSSNYLFLNADSGRDFAFSRAVSGLEKKNPNITKK